MGQGIWVIVTPYFGHLGLTSIRPIFSLILGTKTLIVLTSDTAVKDLMDKRSGIYSSRQDAYVGSDLVSGGLRVLLMVGKKWRSYICHSRASLFVKVLTLTSRRNTAQRGA